MSLTTEQLATKAAAFKKADALQKKYSKERAALQKELLAHMEETKDFKYDCDDFTLTYKAAYDTHGLDTTALKAAFPEYLETYPKVTPHSASLVINIKNTVTEDETEEE